MELLLDDELLAACCALACSARICASRESSYASSSSSCSSVRSASVATCSFCFSAVALSSFSSAFSSSASFFDSSSSACRDAISCFLLSISSHVAFNSFNVSLSCEYTFCTMSRLVRNSEISSESKRTSRNPTEPFLYMFLSRAFRSSSCCSAFSSASFSSFFKVPI